MACGVPAKSGSPVFAKMWQPWTLTLTEEDIKELDENVNNIKTVGDR